MNIVKTWQATCANLEETLALAAVLGQSLRGGEVIELVSDLGGGKTTFVRGLAQGFGSTDRVSSPSFTLTNQYTAGDLTIQHFDFYRLSEPGIMRDELAEVVADPQMITVVEWAGIVEDVLPPEHLTIKLTATTETGRTLEFTYPDNLTYLMEKIAA
jgi:tRNA threonylcarbamoyladenosine biosynthesis protein TsaE